MEKIEIIDGLKLNYTESGSGKAVILLHGWGCDLNIFKNVTSELVKNFKVYAIDLPGFGKSDEPETVWGIDRYTKLIENFCSTKGIESPILMGHSFGGRISILFSSRNKTRKVILVDSAGVKPKRSLKYYMKVYWFKVVKSCTKLLLGKKRGAEVIENNLKKRASSDYLNASPIMRGVLSKVVNEDLQRVMPKIKAPTLLVWGDKDTATPIRDAKIMEKKIEGSGLVIFEGAGHFSFIDRLGEFNIIIGSFLKGDGQVN